MSEPKNWNVLVVDDEPHNVQVVQHILTFFGAKVQTCASGQECLDALKGMTPDFILLDIQMPQITGFDVIREIRRDPAVKHLTVIALTALAMPGDYARVMEAGFDAYITKPLDVGSLVNQITSVLENKHS